VWAEQYHNYSAKQHNRTKQNRTDRQFVNDVDALCYSISEV